MNLYFKGQPLKHGFTAKIGMHRYLGVNLYFRGASAYLQLIVPRGASLTSQ